MRRLKFASTLFSVAALFAFATGAIAQSIDNISLGAVQTLTFQPSSATAYTSNSLKNTGGNGVLCTYKQTTSSGSPSTVFAVQFFDAASATWQTFGSTPAIVDGNDRSIIVYPGAVATSVPTNMVVVGLKVPETFRTSVTVTGASAGIYATVGCSLLK